MQSSRIIPAIAALIATAPLSAVEEDHVDFGGALRFQYSYEDYDDDNTERFGDIDLDTFRINVSGAKQGILFDAEYRFYQYMHTIHHGWVGYQYEEGPKLELGVTQVPFGNLPFNSHGFFFSSNYYLGLEDDYDMGAKLAWEGDNWSATAAFFKNDELGGVDGFVEDRNDRYSYDITGERLDGEGTYDAVSDDAVSAGLGETNTVNLRGAYDFAIGEGMNINAGASLLAGQLNDGSDDAGSRWAAAAHANIDIDRWNVQLQVTGYEYDLDSDGEMMTVGAYNFTDTIPTEAVTFTANVAYTLPLDESRVFDSITFYNDFSLVTEKSADLDDTYMNALGAMVAAGSVYSYLDILFAENQPFVGGSMGSNADDNTWRVNLNVGYYF